MIPQSILRRVEALEGRRLLTSKVSGERARKLHDMIVGRAVRRFPEEISEILLIFTENKKQGIDPEDGLSKEDLYALNQTFKDLFNDECMKEGYASTADFIRACKTD
jgi:hypothetical protein